MGVSRLARMLEPFCHTRCLTVLAGLRNGASDGPTTGTKRDDTAAVTGSAGDHARSWWARGRAPPGPGGRQLPRAREPERLSGPSPGIRRLRLPPPNTSNAPNINTNPTCHHLPALSHALSRRSGRCLSQPRSYRVSGEVPAGACCLPKGWDRADPGVGSVTGDTLARSLRCLSWGLCFN